MSYISHTDYTKMLNAFGKETPKRVLKEGLDPVGKEDEDIDNDGKKNTKTDKYLAKRRKAVGKAISKNKTVKESEEGDVEVDKKLEKIANLHKGKKIDFETIEKIAKALEGQGHEVNARYVQQFLSQHGVGMNEASYADNYQGSWGYREGKEDKKGDFEVGKYLGRRTYEIIRPDDKVSQVRFDNEIEDEIDPPYGYSGYISGEDDDYYYTMDAQFVDMGGGDYDVEPDYDSLDVRDKSKKEGRELGEGGSGDAPISQMSRKDMIDFLGTTEEKAKGMSDEELRNAVIEKNEDMKEGLHTPPLQATGPTVDVTENSISNPPFGFDVLSPDERKQLKEFIESYKTIKGEIAKLLEKAGKSGKIMEDKREDDEAVPAERPMQYKSKPGGNRTGLVMTKAEMWENENPGEIKNKIKPEVLNKVDKTLDVLRAVLEKEGLEGWEIEMFIKHEIETRGKEAFNAQHDPY